MWASFLIFCCDVDNKERAGEEKKRGRGKTLASLENRK